MTRTMYDAVTASNVPTTATLVAGYGDGYYANIPAFRARFPHATVVEIAVSSHHDLGTVLDVETGDATPAEAPPWVKMRRAAGVDPTVYCNSSTWPSVRAAFAAAGVSAPHYWIAQYDNVASIPASWTALGCIAKQYADPGPYDLSVVADYWPGVDPGGDMPLTDADAATVWNHPLTDAATGKQITPATIMAWMDRVHGDQNGKLDALTKALTAVTASVATIGTAVAGVASAVAKLGSADAELLADLQAAQSALADIPAQIATALENDVVHVHVDVTAPTVTGA